MRRLPGGLRPHPRSLEALWGFFRTSFLYDPGTLELAVARAVRARLVARSFRRIAARPVLGLAA